MWQHFLTLLRLLLYHYLSLLEWHIKRDITMRQCFGYLVKLQLAYYFNHLMHTSILIPLKYKEKMLLKVQIHWDRQLNHYQYSILRSFHLLKFDHIRRFGLRRFDKLRIDHLLNSMSLLIIYFLPIRQWYINIHFTIFIQFELPYINKFHHRMG